MTGLYPCFSIKFINAVCNFLFPERSRREHATEPVSRTLRLRSGSGKQADFPGACGKKSHTAFYSVTNRALARIIEINPRLAVTVLRDAQHEFADEAPGFQAGVRQCRLRQRESLRHFDLQAVFLNQLVGCF